MPFPRCCTSCGVQRTVGLDTAPASLIHQSFCSMTVVVLHVHLHCMCGCRCKKPSPSSAARSRVGNVALQFPCCILLQIMTTDAGSLPLDRIFIKQRLDLLTARAWLDEDAKLKKKVQALPHAAARTPTHRHTTRTGHLANARPRKPDL